VLFSTGSKVVGAELLKSFRVEGCLEMFERQGVLQNHIVVDWDDEVSIIGDDEVDGSCDKLSELLWARAVRAPAASARAVEMRTIVEKGGDVGGVRGRSERAKDCPRQSTPHLY